MATTTATTIPAASVSVARTATIVRGPLRTRLTSRACAVDVAAVAGVALGEDVGVPAELAATSREVTGAAAGVTSAVGDGVTARSWSSRRTVDASPAPREAVLAAARSPTVDGAPVRFRSGLV